MTEIAHFWRVSPYFRMLKITPARLHFIERTRERNAYMFHGKSTTIVAKSGRCEDAGETPATRGTWRQAFVFCGRY